MSGRRIPTAMPERVGIIAGWGRYPVVVAEALAARQVPTYCLGIRDHADERLAEICDDFQWLGIARLGAALAYFRRHGLRQATMAGKVHKVRIFQPRFLWRNFPDWRAVRTFWPHFVSTRKDRKDDTLLGAIVSTFSREGIEVRPATDFCPELLVKYGQLSARGPSRSETKDIEFGWNLAKEMGRLDVGQSVAVKDRAVLAVEALEGTDECIRRAGKLCTKGSFTVIKVAKPQQDMRFDVPTIGLGTLQTMIESGARILAVEAGKTILLDEARFLEFANRHGLVVVALDGAAAAGELDAA